MARKKKSTKVELVETPSEPPVYEYKEPEVVEPKMKNFGAMYKDAGAGVTKYFKVTAVRNIENSCFLVIKSGKLGEGIKTKTEEGFDDFIDACKKADELVSEKKKRGYKIK